MFLKNEFVVLVDHEGMSSMETYTWDMDVADKSTFLLGDLISDGSYTKHIVGSACSN